MNTGRIITALAAILAIPAMAADAPGYFQVPGTDTTMKIYGQVELRNQYGLNGNEGLLDASTDPADGEVVGGKITDQSWNRQGTWKTSYRGRFGFTTTTPSSFGNVNVKVEGQANSKTTDTEPSFTLRHAYGEIGGFLLGQTDSLFGYGHYEPNSLWGIYTDENGDWIKARQVRYIFAPTKEINIGLSIEQERSGNESVGGNNTNPVICGAFTYSSDWGGVAATVGFVKKSDWEMTGKGTPAQATHTESENAFNWAVSGCWNITSNDVLTAMVVDAGGDWGPGGTGLLADGFLVDKNGDFKWYKTTTWNLAYGHTWNDQFSSNIGIGQVLQKKDTDFTDVHASTKTTLSEIFVNTYWQAAKNVKFGAEYQYGVIKSNDADIFVNKSGDVKDKNKDSQIRFLAMFKFF